MAKNTSIESLVAQLVDHLAERLSKQLGTGKAAKGSKAGGKRASSRSGKKLDMSCRVAGCKNRSRGPRFGFICDEHRKKLSKGEQAAARDAWKAKHK